jgi:hypothetical protein
MAGADYWKCEICGCKAFYDAQIEWWSEDNWTGALAALCVDCSKTHQLAVRKRDAAEWTPIEPIEKEVGR